MAGETIKRLMRGVSVGVLLLVPVTVVFCLGAGPWPGSEATMVWAVPCSTSARSPRSLASNRLPHPGQALPLRTK